MTGQTYISGLTPEPATEPWTGNVESATQGIYLVIEADNRQINIYIFDGESVWMDYRDLEPQNTPKIIARIRPEVMP